MQNQQIHEEVGGIPQPALLPLNFIPLRRQPNLEHGGYGSAVRGKMTAAREAALAVRIAKLLTIFSGSLTVLSSFIPRV